MNAILYGLFFLLMFASCNSATRNSEAIKSKSESIALCNESMAILEGTDNLPIPKYREGIGNCSLTISSKNEEAQKWFNQGLNHLHGFWHLEAYRAFKQAIKLDSTAAMGYWGLAMCQPGFGSTEPIWVQAIDKASSLKNNTSDFEKAMIDASAILVKQGIAAAQEPFRHLYKTYPNEPEAIAFTAIILRQHEDENTQQEVKKILENAMKKYPDNVALMHYYIHVMELRTEFMQANDMAIRMIKIAPNAPHLRHMPGHLYYLAGNYERAIEMYEVARKIETEYHQKEQIPSISNQNYIHNLQFLAVAQSEINYESALKTANELASISLKSRLRNVGAAQMFAYEGQILPALVHIRFRNWEAAINHFDKILNSLDNPVNNSLVKIYFQVMRLYCEGMQAITKKDIEQAIKKGAELSQLMQQFEQEGSSKQNTSEFKSINETYDIMSIARYELAGWIDNIDSKKPFNDAAWKEAINLQNAIKYDEPPRLMYPVEESLARLHRYRKENEPAENAIKQALKRRPKSRVIKAI